MFRFKLLILLFSFFSIVLNAQLQSPSDFLPHEHGTQFTPHHQLVDYVQAVALNSPNVTLTSYGKTNQDRPLLLAFISSPENLERLEEIRKNNLRKTGLLEGDSDPNLDVAILWMSFGVHGNEAGASESSISVLFELANPENRDIQDWLKNTIVIFDPSLNPDGYDRYTHWFRGTANKIPNPSLDVREHYEPWPGGRVNHYLFDLNRDWAWQTQVESQQRLKTYQQWMPHIHVDFHEQGQDDNYYFAPAAKPFHQYISQWQRDFQVEIGKNHAKYFDEEGWLYFTRESFDLLYPSYGDTYPTFNGAIGMTYEQAGQPISGRAVILENGDTMVLKDRIAHHTKTAISTLEMASKNAKALVQNFEGYFLNSSTKPTGAYKTFIIKGDNPKGRLKTFCSMLEKNGIQYGRLSKNASLRAFDYQEMAEKVVDVTTGDLIISAYQPRSILTQVLLEPKTKLFDSLTYDITAWSLPYAYGLEAYASQDRVDVQLGYNWESWQTKAFSKKTPYAYLVNWESVEDARFLGALLLNGIVGRFATKEFSIEGNSYPRGTLIFTKGDNRKLGNRFHQTIKKIAEQYSPQIKGVQTGFSDNGIDLGSSSMKFIKKPEILILSGTPISPYSFGQVWHYFEEVLGFPVNIIEADRFSRTDLKPYNLLIIPELNGALKLGQSDLDQLNKWISKGGRVIAIGTANKAFENKKGFKLSVFPTKAANQEADNKKDQEALSNRLNNYKDQERRSISYLVPGAIFKLKLDSSHPLGFGLPKHYFSLKTNSLYYKHLKSVWNVGTIGETPKTIGFVGSKALENAKNTTVFAVENKGSGSITYMIDNPLFRGFWENGLFLFGNAVFFVGQ